MLTHMARESETRVRRRTCHGKASPKLLGIPSLSPSIYPDFIGSRQCYRRRLLDLSRQLFLPLDNCSLSGFAT
jgi:hypothetical protein